MTIRRTTRSPLRQGLLDERKARQLLEKAVAEFADKEIKPRFHAAVADWKTRINFKTVATVGTDQITVAVVPHGKNKKIFMYVDKGTPEHDIKPKRKFVRNKKGRLAFVWGGKGSYKPKTRPVAQAGVGPGKVLGGSLVRPLEVHHPGTEARLFSETIEKDVTPLFRRHMDNTFRKIVRQK